MTTSHLRRLLPDERAVDAVRVGCHMMRGLLAPLALLLLSTACGEPEQDSPTRASGCEARLDEIAACVGGGECDVAAYESVLADCHASSSSLVDKQAAGKADHIGPRNGHKVLVVVSAAQWLEVHDAHTGSEETFPTGYFLRELSDPLAAMLAAGYSVDYATVEGKVPVQDQQGNRSAWFRWPPSHAFSATSRRDRALELVNNEPGLAAPIALSELGEEQLDGYVGVYVPGGHAPMMDLVNHPEMGRVLRHFHENKKPTGLICHAPIAMLSTHPDAAGLSVQEIATARFPTRNQWIYADYRVTAASDLSEWFLERFGYIAGLRVPYYVAGTLEAAGAELDQNPIPGGPKVVRDRELVTGQNPFSSLEMGDVFTAALNEYVSQGGS